MTELIIDGQPIELGESKIQVTKQIGDLMDLKDRRTSFTNSFNIPSTQANNARLGDLDILGSTNGKQYKSNEAFLIDGGVPIMQRGIAYIKSINEDEIKVSLKEGNVLLFDAISGKRLKDLDFTGLNHTLIPQAIVDSYAHTWQDGYIYALADFGQSVLNQGIAATQSPCLFKLWLFDKILTDAGFTYSGSVFSDLGIQTDVITMARGHDVETDGLPPVQYVEATSSGSIDESSSGGTPIFVNETVPLTAVLDIDGVVDGDTITISQSAVYEFDVSVTFSNIFISPPNLDPRFEIRSPSLNFPILTIQGSGSSTTSIYLEAGTVLTGRVIANAGGGSFADVEFDYSLTWDLVKDTNTIQINFPSLIGEMSQTDFIKDFISSEGLMFTVDDDNDYQFKRITEIVEDRDGAADMSIKFSRVKSREWSLSGFGVSSRLTYRYENGEDAGFMDGEILSSNETLTRQTAVISRPWTAPSSAGYPSTFEGLQILSCKLFELDENDEVTKLSGNQYTGNIVFTTSAGKSWSMDGFTTVNAPAPIPVLQRNEEDGQYILDNVYPWLKNQIDRHEKVTLEMTLDALDIYAFDPMKLIYISELGVYLFVNSIKKTGDSLADVDATIIW